VGGEAWNTASQFFESCRRDRSARHIPMSLRRAAAARVLRGRVEAWDWNVVPLAVGAHADNGNERTAGSGDGSTQGRQRRGAAAAVVSKTRY
jgi:hypothetical protein